MGNKTIRLHVTDHESLKQASFKIKTKEKLSDYEAIKLNITLYDCLLERKCIRIIGHKTTYKINFP